MRRLAILSAFLALPLSCASLQSPFTNPFKDTTVDNWCTTFTKGQAFVSSVVIPALDASAQDSAWLLRYGLAKGALEAIGPRLAAACAAQAAGDGQDKLLMAYGTQQAARALGDLVELHQVVTLPKPEPGDVRAFGGFGLSVQPGPGMLLSELRMAESQATAVLAKK